MSDKEFAEWMREFYNKKAKSVFKGDYECYRWFSTPIKKRQYAFTTLSLLYHLRDIRFKNCLEIGCGAGTWTKLLIKKYPKARFTCLDISKEMIKQFKIKIKSKRVKIIINNFLDQEFKSKYDFIFCSRAIEYIPNKPEVIKKFYELLLPGGNGIIVSSSPHPVFFRIKKLFKRKINLQHTQRISVKDLYKLLKNAGFVNIEFYPILFSELKVIPTKRLFKNLYKKKFGILSRIFATGYITKFKKFVYSEEKNEKI